jgi:hypothetical protein
MAGFRGCHGVVVPEIRRGVAAGVARPQPVVARKIEQQALFRRRLALSDARQRDAQHQNCAFGHGMSWWGML